MTTNGPPLLSHTITNTVAFHIRAACLTYYGRSAATCSLSHHSIQLKTALASWHHLAEPVPRREGLESPHVTVGISSLTLKLDLSRRRKSSILSWGCQTWSKLVSAKIIQRYEVYPIAWFRGIEHPFQLVSCRYNSSEETHVYLPARYRVSAFSDSLAEVLSLPVSAILPLHNPLKIYKLRLHMTGKRERWGYEPPPTP